MGEPNLKRPGVVVNWLKGDPAESRANEWLEWDGTWDLDAAFVGAPFDGAGTVRSGSRHAPDAVRGSLPWYTSYSTTDGLVMDALRVADIGDVHTIVTDMKTSYENISGTTAFLAEKDIALAIVGGDNSITYPAVRGVCRGQPGKTVAIVHFDAHHDLRESHYGAMSSGVPYRLLLEEFPDQVQGRHMTQIGISDFCNNPTHAAYAKERASRCSPTSMCGNRGSPSPSTGHSSAPPRRTTSISPSISTASTRRAHRAPPPPTPSASTGGT